MDYRRFYDLEKYLFSEVNEKFHKTGYLSVEDFFCIIIWKANRAKTRISKLIKKKRKGNERLKDLIKELTQGISDKQLPEEKMEWLISDWRFRLPIASAILTVLYPDEFTIYDVRVCKTIDSHKSLADRTKFQNLWKGYLEYKDKVSQYGPEMSLREKDKYIWGESFYTDLKEDSVNEFRKK